MHKAAQCGKVELVKVLLNTGADPQLDVVESLGVNVEEKMDVAATVLLDASVHLFNGAGAPSAASIAVTGETDLETGAIVNITFNK